MICKMFISRIYLCSIFIFIGMSGLYCMDQEAPSASAAAPQIYAAAGVQGQASTGVNVLQATQGPEFQLIPGNKVQYNKESSNLIDLVFFKAIDLIFDLKDAKNTSIIEFNLIEPPLQFESLKIKSLKIFFNLEEGNEMATVPAITPEDYLKRMKDFFRCSSTSFVVALIYVERFINKYGKVNFNQFTFYRIWLSALVFASKFSDDIRRTNNWNAKVGGISVGELNDLEFDFLQLMDFFETPPTSLYSLYVSQGAFDSFVSRLKSEETTLMVSLRKKYTEERVKHIIQTITQPATTR